MFEAEVSLEKARQPQTTVVGHSSYMHTHTYTHTHTRTRTRTHTHTHAHARTHTHTHTYTHTHTLTHTNVCTRLHTSGNLLTDGIYCAGEETVPQPTSDTAGRGGQGIEKPKHGGARTTLKATTNSSTVKERAGVRSRGLTGKGASTSDDSGGSLFLHAHTHTDTHTNVCTRIHTSGNLLTDGIYCAGEETTPQPASRTAGRGGQGVEKPKRGGARTTQSHDQLVHCEGKSWCSKQRSHRKRRVNLRRQW